MIINTGGRDVVITKITIRGQTADFGTVYFEVAPVTTDLLYVPGIRFMEVQEFQQPPTIAAATGIPSNHSSKSGDTMTVYVVCPDSITINDIGLTVGITVFTSQAMYYQEANVQAYNPYRRLNIHKYNQPPQKSPHFLFLFK